MHTKRTPVVSVRCLGLGAIWHPDHLACRGLAWRLRPNLGVVCSSRIGWWSTGWTASARQSWKGSGLQPEEITMPTRWLLSIPRSCWTAPAQPQSLTSPVRPPLPGPAWRKSTISQHRCQRWRSMYEKRSLQWKSKTYVYFYCPRAWLRLWCAACFSCKWLPALNLTSFTYLFSGVWIIFLLISRLLNLNTLLEGSSLNMFLYLFFWT